MDSNDCTAKTRAEIKAQRREKQDLQRAAKLAKKEGTSKQKTKEESSKPRHIETVPKISDASVGRIVSVDVAFEIERLSSMWTNGDFFDSTCLTLGLVDSLVKLLSSSENSMEKILETTDEYITYATEKINLPTDSDSFLNHLKCCVPQCMNQECLFESLESFRQKRLISAVETVGLLTKRVLKIRGVKSVAVYGYTLSVYSALTDWEDPLDDLVVYVIECSLTKLKSTVLMDKLCADGIEAHYVNLSAIATALPNVDIVLVGSETIYADGSIKAVSGSSAVLLMAAAYRIPVYVLYETLKLSINVFNPTIKSRGFEVVSRRFPMTFVSENDIHTSILGFAKRSANIPT